MMNANEPTLFDIDEHKPSFISDISTSLAQANSICRAAYDMSILQKRLITAALKALQTDSNPHLEAVLNFTDVLKAFGQTTSTVNYRNLRASIRTMASLVINIDTSKEDGFLPWLGGIWIAKDRSYVRIQFNKQLKDYIEEVKKDYALIDLKDEGSLKSYYAIRIYELVKSQEGNKGKNGNPPGVWFYYSTVENLREILMVKDKYASTADFRKKLIDGPCKEINAACIGLRIVPEYIRKAKYLTAIKLICTEEIRQSKQEEESPAPFLTTYPGWAAQHR